MNFLGALQGMEKLRKKDRKNKKQKYKMLPRVCGRGVCTSEEDGLRQLKDLYKTIHPQYAAIIDDENTCWGGICTYDCTIYELIEKAADGESALMIRLMYDESIDLG